MLYHNDMKEPNGIEIIASPIPHSLSPYILVWGNVAGLGTQLVLLLWLTLAIT